MKKLNYYIVDVFSNQKYAGNPLAVVWCDDDLEVEQYHQIAREFGYAETSFLQYSSNDESLKVRSFTPSGFEVSGAGHNLLGAVCLALLKGWNIFEKQNGEQYVFMKDTRIKLAINCANPDVPFVGVKQQPAIIGKKVPAKKIAAAIGLSPEMLLLNEWEPTVVKTEVAHLIVPVSDSRLLNRAVTNKVLLREIAEEFDFQGCYLFTTDHPKPTVHLVESRFFNPGIGIDEDAATGSAAGPLAGYLYYHQYITANRDYLIAQGIKMDHPSCIVVNAVQDGIWVSGYSVMVMEGSLYL